jgi:hypothetical protein
LPGTLQLLLENASRFGDRGGMLPPEQVPEDRLRRVVVNWRDEPGSEVAGAGPWFPSLIAEAVGLLLEAGDRLWCVGEIHRKNSELLRDGLPELTSLETNAVKCLVISPLPPSCFRSNVRWPPYCGDYGFRLLAFRHPATSLEGKLRAIYETMRSDAEAAIEEWERLRWALIRRADLAQACTEAAFGVQPDGPHFFEASFHTRELECEAVVQAFQRVCQSHGLQCESKWNRTDEYLDFFDLRRPPAS